MPVNMDLLRSLQNVSSLDQLRLNAQNQLETRSTIGRLCHNIADFFRNLSPSGRATIASRNEAIAAAVKAAVNEARGSAQPQEVQDIASRLKAVNISLQNAAVTSKSTVFSDMLAAIQGDSHYKALAPQAQSMLNGALTKIANEAKVADWPAQMGKLRDIFFGKAPAGFDIALGMQKFGESNKTSFFSPEQQAEVLPDGIHMAFLKDAKRDCMSCIGTAATPKSLSHADFTTLLKDLLGEQHARFLPFVSMMCSQAGMDSAMIYLPYQCGLSELNYEELINCDIMPTDSKHTVAITREGDTLTITDTFSQGFAPMANLSSENIGLSCNGTITMKIDLSAEPETAVLKDLHTKNFTKDSGEQIDTQIIAEKTIYLPRFSMESASVAYVPAQD